MPKYRALVDIPPSVKAGDVVTVEDKLLPEYEKKLSPVGDGEETDDEKVALANPSREELKVRANELGLDFAPNINTAKLLDLVTEAEAAKAAEGE